MAAIHLASLAFFVLSGACFLLVTFGIDHAGGAGLTPLGLLCFVIAVALHHHHGLHRA